MGTRHDISTIACARNTRDVENCSAYSAALYINNQSVLLELSSTIIKQSVDTCNFQSSSTQDSESRFGQPSYPWGYIPRYVG